MKSLRDTLEEAFRTGHNMAHWDNSDQDAALARYLARPPIAELVAKTALVPSVLRCSKHGEIAPLPACPACVLDLQHATEAFRAASTAANLENMQDPL